MNSETNLIEFRSFLLRKNTYTIKYGIQIGIEWKGIENRKRIKCYSSIGDDARIAGLPGGMDNARIKERKEWIARANAGERMDNIGRKNG